MVQRQIVARGVRDLRVLAAMRSVRRHEFVDARNQPAAYEDRPLSIGHGQTISQPYIVAWMTELLQVGPQDCVLEIGTGCGYQTAVLAQLAAHVYSIELDEALSAQAALNLSRAGVTNATLKVGDGYQGWPEHAPFPCIISAAAPLEVPAVLTRQLADGGRLVLPVGAANGQQMMRVTRGADGTLVEEVLGAVSFVPMRHA
ncbi:MAG: protein-L-isoaspartate(D-aspartate) O-methyltransferase [Planctomycetes bacterium]|nr:protein-L-isoaspartate(D-aspartate) O-methyltransferase [Planctomycetota bacterium]